jgi:hypothetical protein
VAAAVVVPGFEVSTIMVFFCPVEFVVGEGFVVEAAEETQDVGIVVQVSEVIAMVFEVSCFVPSFCDAWVILPCVEEIEMFGGCPINNLERKVLVHFGDVAGIANALGSRFWAADRMAGVDALRGELHGEVVVLGHQRVVGERCAERGINAVAEDPDGTRTSGRRGTLPKRATQDEELVAARDGLVGQMPCSGMFDG